MSGEPASAAAHEGYDRSLATAQAVVLHSKAYAHAKHWLVHAPPGSNPHGLLHRLLGSRLGATLGAHHPDQRLQPLQLGIGLSFAGLARLDVPDPVLNVFRARSRAFAAGAAVRAASSLNDHGHDAAPFWDAGFAHDRLHLVLSLQARQAAELHGAAHEVQQMADACGVEAHGLDGEWLGPPAAAPADGHWVHFGYRDALAKMHVRGWPYRPDGAGRAQHAAGEFLLGHVQDSGANPWALSALPSPVRDFFFNGAFGVLRQIEQNEAAFRRFLDESAERLAAHLDAQGHVTALGAAARHQRLRAFVQAKLMGRWPSGQHLSAHDRPEDPAPHGPVHDDFTHKNDGLGQGCPFGAHIRRMNPRDGETSLAHSRRARVLLRRGMPYGPAYDEGECPTPERGMLGLFFCASLEDQFEHILGQWGAGIALGSPDSGNAHDPFVSPQPASARFVIPLPGGDLVLPVCDAFVRTRGTAYLFHPSLPALQQLASQGPWREERGDAA